MSSFSTAHRLYVKSLYRRFLINELDWVVNRQEWRARAMNVRAEFERNRLAPSAVDGTGFSILTSRTEMFTTLELWLQSFKKLRLTLPNIVTQIATFVSLLPILPPSSALTYCPAFLPAPSMPDGTKWSVFFATPSYAPFLIPTVYRERNVPVGSNHPPLLDSMLTLPPPTSLPLSQSLTTKPMVTIEYLCHNNQSLSLSFVFRVNAND